MATASIQFRLDEQTKKRAEKALKRMGMDMPTAMRIYVVKIADTGSIPFDLSVPEAEDDFFTPEQVKALDRLAEEAEKEEHLLKSYSSAQEMIDDLNAGL